MKYDSLEFFNKQVFDALPDWVAILDPTDCTILDSNENSLNIFGKRSDDIIGENCCKLFHRCEVPNECPLQRMLVTGNKETLEIKKNGNWFSVLVSPVFNKNGDIKYAVHHVRNVTVDKTTHHKLIKSEEKYKNIYTKTPVMLHSLNGEGYLISVSDYWLKTLGYNETEVLGHKSIEFLTEKSRKYAVDTALPLFFKQGFIKDVPFQMLKKNGKVLDVLLSAIAEYDDQGNILRTLAVISDVTELNQIKTRLISNQNRLTTAEKIAKVGSFSRDFTENRLEWSEQMYELFGYQPYELQPDFDLVLSHIHPEDRQAYLKAYDDMLKRNIAKNLEYRIICRAGNQKFILSKSILEIDQSGKPIRQFGAAQDITSRKLLENEIIEKERLFRKLTEISPTGIYLADAHGDCTYVNRSWLKMSGFTAEEAYGKGWINALHPEDKEHVKHAWYEMAKTGKTWKQEYRIVDRKGKISSVFGFAVPVEVGLERIYMGVNVDITDRKKAEQKVQEAELRYQMVADYTYDWEYWGDLKGAIIYMSPSCKRITGYTYKEFQKDTQLLNKIIYKEDQAIWKQHLEKRTSNKWKSMELQFRIMTKQGQIRWIEHICRPVVVCRREHRGYRVSNRDMTERKHTQQQLQKTLNQLSKIEETLRNKAASDLHDQVGQNLTALNINLGYIKSQLNSQPTDILAKRIDDSLNLLENTIDRIRNIMLDLRPYVLEDHGLVAALRWYAQQFTDRIELKLQFEGKDLSKSLGRHRELVIFRVCQEVFNNIAKHSNANTVQIKINETRYKLIIEIQDDGIGFDRNELIHKRHLGFGLMSIEERMHVIGGTVDIKSRPGEGVHTKITIGK